MKINNSYDDSTSASVASNQDKKPKFDNLSE